VDSHFVLVAKNWQKKSREMRKAENAPIALWNSDYKPMPQTRERAIRRRLAIPPAPASINHSPPSELKTILISI
jgi:hypothetical protein